MGLNLLEDDKQKAGCETRWQVNLRNAWLQFSSCVVAGAVVFANSIRTIYESVVFLFVVHPFDVGDGIFIGALPDYYVMRSNPRRPGQMFTGDLCIVRQAGVALQSAALMPRN